MVKNGFYIEGVIKEYNGKFYTPVDNFKGEINEVMESLSIKYSKPRKKGLFTNIGTAFDLAGEHLEKL